MVRNLYDTHSNLRPSGALYVHQRVSSEEIDQIQAIFKNIENF